MIVTVLIMTISGIALPLYAQAVDAARITRAIGDIRAMANEIMAFQILNGDVPDTLDEVGYGAHRDPYGNPYQFLKFGSGPGGGPGGGGFMGDARKDKFLVPINSRYDLYSMGKDGESVAPLMAPQSRDDIVMANDGGFVGLAENY
jgi:general secretion pathway protein G